MKKIFTKRLFVYMLAALLVTITGIFVMQTVITQKNNTASSYDKIQNVKETLASNEKNIEHLTNNLSENNLAKTRAFADMLAIDPSIAGNTAKLNRIKDRLQVNELHIIDEEGIITSSSIPAYIGFDMKSGEQSNAFMVIVEDPSIEIAQEPQNNVAEGIMMQYIGVSRTDAKGLVQVGVRPEVLENVLANTSLDVVLKNVDFGETGYVYAIDASSGIILAHPNVSLIGISAVNAGFPKELTGQGKAKIDGVEGYYFTEEYEGKMIGTFMPAKEYYAQRRDQTVVVSFSMLLIFGLLLICINQTVDRKIVRGINRITSSMKGIADGDFSIIVNETGNPEFVMLSDSMNKMVGNISQNIRENERLVERQKQDMENNQKLIRNIKNACKKLYTVSGENLKNADHIYNGTGEQEKAVEDLKGIMDRLVKELNSGVDATADITVETGNAAEKIMQTQEKMKLLNDSINKISEMSMAIVKMIGEINSIAQQTNILSLNASIEAARAGEVGKCFAVVASQVGELADRSARAAKETNELIANSINAVENGKAITDQTVEAFSIMAENVEKSNQGVLAITEMVKKNVDIVTNAVSQIGRISNVVEENVQISQDTKQASSNIADITGQMLRLIGQQ